jgi:hypothetical protein
MTAMTQNETLWQGKSETITVNLTQPDLTTPVPITGTLRWELWHVLTGVALEKTSDVEGGIVISAEHTNQCAITIDVEDTTELLPLTYWQGLFYIPQAGNSDMIMQGLVTVNPSRGLEEAPHEI